MLWDQCTGEVDDEKKIPRTRGLWSSGELGSVETMHGRRGGPEVPEGQVYRGRRSGTRTDEKERRRGDRLCTGVKKGSGRRGGEVDGISDELEVVDVDSHTVRSIVDFNGSRVYSPVVLPWCLTYGGHHPTARGHRDPEYVGRVFLWTCSWSRPLAGVGDDETRGSPNESSSGRRVSMVSVFLFSEK